MDSTQELLNTANAQVLEKTGQPLSEVQLSILQQVLDGKRLNETHIVGYTDGTIQRNLTPKLWRLLTHVIGQPVAARTVRIILEKVFEDSGTPSAADVTTSSSCTAPAHLNSPILHNLPAPTYTEFIGREKELAQLLEHLSFERSAHIISIDGTGGVGKTALAMEAAYCYLRGKLSNGRILKGITFDAIVFISCKDTYLTPIGLIRNYAPHRGLNDVLRQIAIVLDLDLTGLAYTEQVGITKKALSKKLCWLIIDNLESVELEQQEQILAFLYELPISVKTVITTRKQIVFVPVRLSSMEERDSLCLIAHETNEKGVSLSQQEKLAIHQATGGVPIAICFAVGLLANGYLMDEVLARLAHPTGDIGQFCFESSVSSLRETPAHLLLMAFALFQTSSVERETLLEIAAPDLDLELAREALATLRGFSLIQQKDHSRYTMLPLMKEYSLAELKANPDREQQLRNRWIYWYVRYSERYRSYPTESKLGVQNGLVEWPNIQAVVQRCMNEERYSDLIVVWKNTEDFIHVIGRKATRLGYWDDRLILADWLIHAAECRGDHQQMAEIMFDRAWLLTLLGRPQQLEEAHRLFMRTLDLGTYIAPYLRHEVGIRLSVVRIRQGQVNQALSNLNQIEKGLIDSDLSDLEKTKLLTLVYYYFGRISFQTEAFEQAEINFQKALSFAKLSNTTRYVFACRNWLADLAIKQGNSKMAEKILNEDLHIARKNQDKWRMACCLRSLSDLSERKGDLEQAKQYLIEAQEKFDALGMEIEVNEIRSLLRKEGQHLR